MSRIISRSEIVTRIASLGGDVESDTDNLRNLACLSWGLESLAVARSSLADGIIKVVEAHHESATAEAKALMGLCLVILGMLPRDVLGMRIYSNRNPVSKLHLILKTIDEALDACDLFFPLDLTPDDHASSLASSITGRLYIVDGELFKTSRSMELASSITFKVWTFGDMTPTPMRPHSERWKPSSMAAVNLMRNLLDDERGRQALMRYCEADSITRWDTLVGWVRERTKVLQRSSDSVPEDIYDLAVIIRTFQSQSVQLALRLPACISLSNLSKALRHHRYGSVAHLQTAIEILCVVDDACLAKLSGYELMRRVSSLLKSGIMIPVREVVVYTTASSAMKKVDTCWKIFFTFMDMILHPQTIMPLRRASDALTLHGSHPTAPVWETFEGTAKLFELTHTYRKGSQGNGFCDNPSCTKGRTFVQSCSACHQASFCSPVCQTIAWYRFHRADCSDYRANTAHMRVIPHDRRDHLMYGLGGLIVRAIKFVEEPTTEHTLVRIDKGLWISPEKIPLFKFECIPAPCVMVPLDDILTIARCMKSPRAFIHLVYAAKTHPRLKLAGLLMIEDDGPVYLFGLFEKTTDPSTNKDLYVPTKIIEVGDCGIDFDLDAVQHSRVSLVRI